MSISSDLKRAAEGAVNAGDHWGRRDSFERQLAKLATPETILVLTAENERLAACLKTANEQAERFERNWYLRGDEIDQLRAEVAGLKTGYEAYERVNAELKAENEALRKHAERYRWLRDSECAGRILRDMGAMVCRHADQRIDAAMGKGGQS